MEGKFSVGFVFASRIFLDLNSILGDQDSKECDDLSDTGLKVGTNFNETGFFLGQHRVHEALLWDHADRHLAHKLTVINYRLNDDFCLVELRYHFLDVSRSSESDWSKANDSAESNGPAAFNETTNNLQNLVQAHPLV